MKVKSRELPGVSHRGVGRYHTQVTVGSQWVPLSLCVCYMFIDFPLQQTYKSLSWVP